MWCWMMYDYEIDMWQFYGIFKGIFVVCGGVFYVIFFFNFVLVFDVVIGKEFWIYDLCVYDGCGMLIYGGFMQCGFEFWSNGEIECIFFVIGIYQFVFFDVVIGEFDFVFGEVGMVDMCGDIGLFKFVCVIGFNLFVIVCGGMVVMGMMVMDFGVK